MVWLPVMLKLDGIRAVVVGGGNVAERKVLALLEAADEDEGKSAAEWMKPFITVISPSLTDKLAALALQGRIAWLQREYLEGDLAGAKLAFAATNAPRVNERVAAEAKVREIWANVADDPETSGMIMPSTLRRGKLMLAVSTAGASPSAARRIRRELEARYGPEYEIWLDWLAEARLLLRRRIADTDRRQELHRELERLDGAALIRSGRLPAAGWQHAWLDAIERVPEPATVRRLGAELP